jgi:hypothetical protein
MIEFIPIDCYDDAKFGTGPFLANQIQPIGYGKDKDEYHET